MVLPNKTSLGLCDSDVVKVQAFRSCSFDRNPSCKRELIIPVENDAFASYQRLQDWFRGCLYDAHPAVIACRDVLSVLVAANRSHLLGEDRSRAPIGAQKAVCELIRVRVKRGRFRHHGSWPNAKHLVHPCRKYVLFGQPTAAAENTLSWLLKALRLGVSRHTDLL